MATEPLNVYDTPGEDVYFVVINSDDEFFDFDDETFKALGSAVEPELAATEDTDAGGIGESGYSADLDLALINATPVIGVFVVQAMQQLGGSPDPDTDLMIGSTELRIANGLLIAEGSAGDVLPGYAVRVGMNVTSTLGNVVQLAAWVEYQGRPVTLGGSDTCVFSCYEHTSGVSKWTPTTPVGRNAATNQFETTVSNPAFQDDTNYSLKATVVLSGVTLYGQDSFPVIGSD